MTRRRANFAKMALSTFPVSTELQRIGLGLVIRDLLGVGVAREGHLVIREHLMRLALEAGGEH